MAKLIVRVNGKSETVEAATLLDVLKGQGIAPDHKGIAVALNSQVVPRALWLQTPVQMHDDIEIVHARQGG